MDYLQVLKEIKNRDLADKKIDLANRRHLGKTGLQKFKPGRIFSLDTSRIEGIDKVASLIKKRLKRSDRVIALEGISGTGKSATAKALAKDLKALRFSFGEFFRYATYRRLQNKKINLTAAVVKWQFKIIDADICLFDGEKNISHRLKKELRLAEVEKNIPQVSIEIQALAIAFFAQEINKLSKNKKRLILEGRAFTLDFLPSDVRIKLHCDARIRAKRRLKQIRKSLV